MSHKSLKIAEATRHLQGQTRDHRYLGYFECFNAQKFYEAHDVLEDLWLADKHGPNGNFYKGLIQLAGAFVHLQKGRLRPAGALFKLALTNLESYPAVHEGLHVGQIVKLIGGWYNTLALSQFTNNPLSTQPAPQLKVFAR
jgi:predicted metal-dependent hydrolase